jgi:PBSX family phage portal protein
MSASKPEKSKVFVYTSKKKLVPEKELRKFELKKDSKQVSAEEKQFFHLGLVSPPFPPESFLQLMDSNVYFDRCVRQIAQDTAGLGWKVVLKEGKEEADQERQEIESFLRKPNTRHPDESMRDVIQASVIDLESVGWFGLEVVRNLGGQGMELYHVPGHTFKVHKSRKKFCQQRNQSKVWFKAYGEKPDIDKDTGEMGKGLSEAKKANELLYHKSYYAKSDYYGVPPILSAVGSVLALIGIRDYNLAFFENYGVPAAIVILEGNWEEGSDEKLRDWLDTEIKRSENAHKTAVLRVADGCKATWIPLVTEVKEAAFKIYLKILRDEVLAAYSMPGYRIGITETGSLGGSTAREATETYLSTVIEPLQETFEEILEKLFLDRGWINYRVEFVDIDVRDIDAEVKRCDILVRIASMNPNEVRNRLSIGEPYEGGNQFYIDSSLIAVGSGDMQKADDFSAALNELRRGLRKLIDERKVS